MGQTTHSKKSRTSYVSLSLLAVLVLFITGCPEKQAKEPPTMGVQVMLPEIAPDPRPVLVEAAPEPDVLKGVQEQVRAQHVETQAAHKKAEGLKKKAHEVREIIRAKKAEMSPRQYRKWKRERARRFRELETKKGAPK